MIIKFKSFHDSLNDSINVSMLNVPNYLQHLQNEVKQMSFFLRNCYHSFLREILSRNKFQKSLNKETL